MKTAKWPGTALVCAALLLCHTAHAQDAQETGKPIGKVSTKGKLIVMTLDEGVLGKRNLFDLGKRTLRFTPDGAGYRVANLPLEWDPDFGPEARGPQVTLHNFQFPFSGKRWEAFSVGVTGSIRFGATGSGTDSTDGVVSFGRFDQLEDAAWNLINSAPAICAFFKPRMTGHRHVKEMADRVVITWNLSEPFGGIQDFTWKPTTNRFQAVLRKDGSVDLSYDEVAAKDSIVGLCPMAPTLKGARISEIHFSTVKRGDGPFAAPFESFHYLATPNMKDLASTVIKGLGDKFDFLVYYSDFRIDNQEAGTPSNGPLGGKVTGIGQVESGLESYGSAGRFQWEFIQPVYAHSNQAQKQPPDDPANTNRHYLTRHRQQLGELTPDGSILPYNYAMSQVGHEMGHRWSAFVSAKVGNEIIHLGDGAHWGPGLQATVAFPYQRPTEASAMGGGAWQDNFDGTFTRLDDNYYVPAKGWSHLDLYLMGLISAEEVPDFFILRNMVPSGHDPQGRAIFRANRIKITIQDVIAAEGPRSPDVHHSQRTFNTGMVVIVEHGKKPGKELIERTNGIRQQWMEYWWRTTGGRSTMTANPR